jgi:hypothetical protein
MHENREISSAPSSLDEGRSAKASGRTADVHVLEKSDCAVVPVNQPNKAAIAAAEAGEGRAQMEENIDQSRMSPTESGNRMSQGLDGVRKAARERKQERFTSLLHHVDTALLRDSFYALKRQASPGVDGVRWQEYESGLEGRLVDLHNRVHRGTFRAQPSRRVYIPKADGRQRPLGVAALEDKGGIMPKRILSLFRNLFRKRDVEQALDDELGSTLEALTQEKIEQGLSQAAARREALIEIGGIEQVKERVRAVRAGHFVEDVARDIRYALRADVRRLVGPDRSRAARLLRSGTPRDQGGPHCVLEI